MEERRLILYRIYAASYIFGREPSKNTIADREDIALVSTSCDGLFVFGKKSSGWLSPIFDFFNFGILTIRVLICLISDMNYDMLIS